MFNLELFTATGKKNSSYPFQWHESSNELRRDNQNLIRLEYFLQPGIVQRNEMKKKYFERALPYSQQKNFRGAKKKNIVQIYAVARYSSVSFYSREIKLKTTEFSRNSIVLSAN